MTMAGAKFPVIFCCPYAKVELKRMGKKERKQYEETPDTEKEVEGGSLYPLVVNSEAAE